MLATLVLLWVTVLAVVTSRVSAAIDAHNIKSIPAFGPPPSLQYSGLLPVDEAKSAFLHYWLVTSTVVPSSKASLTVWLNGGPGCSSLEGGLYEQGPFTFTGQIDNVTGVPMLKENPYAWSTISNMLFIESPIGVGYSYAVNGSVASTDDTTSQNMYGFLLNFFKAYPEMSANEFFITGESYAGFYVPELALRIYEGNKAGNQFINLQAFAVGNACVGEGGSCGRDTSVRTMTNFYNGHGMISASAYETITQACGRDLNSSAAACLTTFRNSTRVGNIWVYNVYDVCGNEFVSPSPIHPPSVSTTRGSGIRRAPNFLLDNEVGDPIMCESLDSTLGERFMNSDAVKRAFHVDQVPIRNDSSPWSVCANVKYLRTTTTLIPRYSDTLLDNYRVLVFNGDADACVPWNGSFEWTAKIGRPIKSSWRPYLINDHYIGGFVVQYDTKPGFAFATAKKAGHMVRLNAWKRSRTNAFSVSDFCSVSQYEPEIGFFLFANFITGSDYSNLPSFSAQ